MVYTGVKLYDILTNTYSTGYWIQDSQGNWYPVWNGCIGKNVQEESEVEE